MPIAVRTTAALSAHLPTLLSAREIALDTEFHSERSFYPKLMLVQLRAEERDPLLIDPLAGVDLSVLRPVFERVPFVAHAGQMDVQILRRAVGVAPNIVFDTQVAAGCAGFGYPTRLAELVRKVTGREISKGETLSDWSRRPLSPDQERYAAEDVFVLAPLVAALRERLSTLGNTEVASGCLTEIMARALAPEDDADAWRLVFGGGVMDDAEKQALRALAAWRDACARELDLPRHNIVGDALLIDLARRRPTTLDQMRMNRRMHSGIIRQHGEAILGRIAAAMELPPLPRRAPFGQPRLDAVRAAARAVEAVRGVAPELILSEVTLNVLAEGGVPDDWRKNALSEDFFEFLRKNCALMADGTFFYLNRA